MSILVDSGNPRYFTGNSAIQQGMTCCGAGKRLSSAKICVMEHFSMLVFSSYAVPNKRRSSMSTLTSWVAGDAKRIASSAYMLHPWWIDLCPSGCSSPASFAFVNIRSKMSITRMNNIGDNGSPCLRPRRWLIRSPGRPFSSTRVEDVDRSSVI